MPEGIGAVEGEPAEPAPAIPDPGGPGMRSALRRVRRQSVLRLLTVTTLSRSVGRGVLLTVSALYLTLERDVTAAQLAVGLVIGGVVSVAASTPAGYLSDRWGARNTAITGLTLEAVVLLGYFAVRGGGEAAVLLGVVGLGEALHAPARAALIAHALPAADRVEGRAFLRSVTNVGWAVGASAGSVVLQFDSPAAYLVGLAVAAALHLLGASVLFRLPRIPEPRLEAGHPGAAFAALRDVPFVVVAALVAMLMVSQTLFTFALPLWIVDGTSAPRATAGALIVVNTVLVALFQLRFSRGVETPVQGGRAMARSGAGLAVACAGYAVASFGNAAVGIALLVAGALFHTWAECVASAGSWALLYGLSPEDSHGRHQAVGNTFVSAGELVSPAIATVLVLQHRTVGWIAFGGVFLACGALTPAATGWAVRRRPVPAVP